MRNKYKKSKDGSTVTIFANGKGSIYEVLIDAEDFKKINSYGTWTVAFEKDGKKVGRVVSGNPATPIHRVIMNYNGDKVIDHIDRNPLNNKKSNLRIVSISGNGQNRSVNSNSSTGVRGLNWNKDVNKYQARIQINKRRITIGYYSSIEEGEKALIEFRKNNTLSID